MFTESAARSPGDRKLIVAVDGHGEFLEIMQELLEEEGYQVVIAPDADRAYRKIRELMPDLVLLDVLMPDVPAWHVMDLLSLHPQTTKIPILVCSAAVNELRERESFLRDQGIDILVKPFELQALLDKVARAIGAPV